MNTDNGGNQWQLTKEQSWPKLYSVSIPSKNKAFAVGYDGTILRYDRYSPSITLVLPNGGESWKAISTHKITWVSTGVTNVKIIYSTDDGSTWQTIVENTQASTGSYSWKVPNITASQCKIRIQDIDNPTISDSTDSVFSIYQDLVILQPNGGENWIADTLQEIKWTTGNTETIKIEYTTNNGLNWTTIINSISANIGSYFWVVPNVTSSSCKIRISDIYFFPFNDESNRTFSIIYQPTVTVTSPNGDETWKAGSTQNITWVSENINNVKIEFSSDNGSNWLTIADNVSATLRNYNWDIPKTTSQQCKIKLSDSGNPNIADESDKTFSVYEALTVTTPDGGESWRAGSIKKISWTSVNTQAIKIEYSTSNGNSWLTIVDNISADVENFYWTIPQITSAECKIKISDISFPNINDESNGPFTIYQPVILLLSPNGGESLIAGSSKIIRWASNFLNKIKIEYTVDNSNTWITIIDSTDASTGNYNWVAPSVASNQCKVRISDISDAEIKDESDGVFSIAKPTIIVIYPNGGETWKEGELKTITWNSSNVSNLKIEYTTDNGATWQPIVNTISANLNNYTWLVPKVESSQCKIRIIDTSNPATNDESDEVFQITFAVGVNEDTSIPTEYGLNQNFPNPFNPSTLITYQLPETGYVSLRVYDMLGKEVTVLVKEVKYPGKYSVVFNANNLSSDIYFYVLSVNDYTESKKMILQK